MCNFYTCVLDLDFGAILFSVPSVCLFTKGGMKPYNCIVRFVTQDSLIFNNILYFSYLFKAENNWLSNFNCKPILFFIAMHCCILDKYTFSRLNLKVRLACFRMLFQCLQSMKLRAGSQCKKGKKQHCPNGFNATVVARFVTHKADNSF